MIFSGRFIFMSEELDWWLKVDVTLSLCTNGSISPKGLSMEEQAASLSVWIGIRSNRNEDSATWGGLPRG